MRANIVNLNTQFWYSNSKLNNNFAFMSYICVKLRFDKNWITLEDGRQNKVCWLKIKLELAKLKFDKLWAHSIPIVNIIGLLSSKAHVWTKFGDWVRRKSENWWKYGIEDVFDDALYNKEENFS